MELLNPDRELTPPAGSSLPKLGLRYSLNAQILFEEAAGKHPREVDWKAPPMQEVRRLLWAALEGHRLRYRTREAPWTVEEAGEVFTDYGGVLGGVYALLLDAMVAGTRSVAGPPEPKGGAPAGEGPPGGGAPSSPAPAPPTGAGSS